MIIKPLKFILTPIFLALLFVPALGYADLMGKDLLEDCEVKLKLEKATDDSKISPADAFQAGACTGYIKGFDDMEILYASILAGPNGSEKEVQKFSLYCLPDKTTNIQMTSVVVKYLKSHAKELNESASIAVAKAFRDSYPCPKTPK